MLKKFENFFVFFDCGTININDADVTFKKASSLFNSVLNTKVTTTNESNMNSYSFNMLLNSSVEFVQFFSSKVVSSEEQIMHALDNAIASMCSRKSFTKSLSLEFLLFLTAQRQLNKALDLLKLNKGKNSVCVLAFCKSKQNIAKAKQFFKKELCFVPKKNVKNVIENNLKKNFSLLKKIFAIEDAELKVFALPTEKALQQLVLEKIALLSLKK